MTPPASETVTAICELPVPIWVSCAALGGTYPSGYGRVQFDVAMPQDLAPAGGPPVIDGVEVPESLDGELVAWTTEYAADVPDEFQPATALRRIVITAVEAPTDAARSWRGPDQQLGECIKFWFDQVRSWVEIFTGQDLDPGHRVYDAETVGAGLTFIAPPREGDLGLQLTTRHLQPVKVAEWQWILAAVRDGKEQPLFEGVHRALFVDRFGVDTAVRPDRRMVTSGARLLRVVDGILDVVAGEPGEGLDPVDGSFRSLRGGVFSWTDAVTVTPQPLTPTNKVVDLTRLSTRR
ncbi:UNVERIFIED_ORG: hypothetical protein ABIB52_000551 [Arthrobacter sp. UYCu721]